MNKKQCLSEDTKILTPIENIIITKEITHFKVGIINIQATNSHTFDIMRKDHKKCLRADELKVGDMFLTSISLLSSGNKVLGSDGKLHTIKKHNK